MTKVTSAAQVLKKIGCDKLKLHRGEGYWYFEYDDPANGIFETHSVYGVPYLSHWTLEGWVLEGQELINKVKEQYK